MSVSPFRKVISQPVPKEPIEEEEQQPLSFRFKEITPEDWRANEAPLADLYQRQIISAEYVRQRLKIPEQAGTGTMAQAPQQQPKPLTDVPSGGGSEKWKLSRGKKGLILERLDR